MPRRLLFNARKPRLQSKNPPDELFVTRVKRMDNCANRDIISWSLMSESRIEHMDRALRLAAENVRPDVHITSRNMFGGRGWWANGQMFAAWFGNELALKLPADAAEALLELPGASPTGRRWYVETPPEFLDDSALLETWVAQSIQLAEQLAAAPSRRRSRRK